MDLVTPPRPVARVARAPREGAAARTAPADEAPADGEPMEGEPMDGASLDGRSEPEP